jgi:hypothetical protein
LVAFTVYTVPATTVGELTFALVDACSGIGRLGRAAAVTVKVSPFTALTVPKTPLPDIPPRRMPPFAPLWTPPCTLTPTFAPTLTLVCANAGMIIAKLAATPIAATHEMVFIIFIEIFILCTAFICCL